MATDQEMIRSHLDTISLSSNQNRTTCPVCGPDRRKHNEKSLSIKIDGDFAVYKCHHCDISGSILIRDEDPPCTPIASALQTSLSEAQVDWLKTRGISAETADRCNVVSGDVYIASRGKTVSCLGWQYENADGGVATKWRDGAKNFSQTGSARSFWRINEWSGGDLIICEGEMDAMSFEESGIWATSVPNGAPSSLTKDPSASSTKYSYLWDSKERVESATRVILATDSDEPGQLLCEEIARRLGKGRCYRVEYPDGCKDANDVLVQHGKDGLPNVLENATPWPVSGLRNVSEYRNAVMDLYTKGMNTGLKAGIPELDNLFRACPQTLTVCTGIPGSGKSAFLGWLSVQLAARSGWQCAVFSAETATQIMLLQLAATFTQTPYSGEGKMTEDELSRALDWIATRYVFLDESETHIESVLERAQAAVLRNGVRILLIDPYNFLTGSLSNYEDSVAGINKLLVSLKAFAVQHDIAVWLVAHPVKMYRQQDGTSPVPTGYDVSGSSAFFNICDSGITISRAGQGKSLFTSWKARFPWVGSLGETELSFDPRTGIFSQQYQQGFGGDGDESFDAL